jgi:ABC-type sugar transport system ATPase subunit
MFLGRELTKHWQLDEIAMEQLAKKTLQELKVVTVRSIRQPVGSLSGGQRQSVAVARTVLQDAKLVILDEPTAALGVTQTQMVLDLITRLAQQNVAVLVISHNLADAMAVADRIAVMYLGTLAAVGPKEQFDNQSIVDLQTTGTSSRKNLGGSSEQ